MVRENFLQKFPAHFSQPHPDANPKDKVLYPQGPTWIKQRRERSDVPRKILMEPAPQAAQECGWPEGRALPVVVSSVWSGGLGSVFSWKTGARVAYMPVRRFKNADLPFSELEV